LVENSEPTAGVIQLGGTYYFKKKPKSSKKADANKWRAYEISTESGPGKLVGKALPYNSGLDLSEKKYKYRLVTNDSSICKCSGQTFTISKDKLAEYRRIIESRGDDNEHVQKLWRKLELKEGDFVFFEADSEGKIVTFGKNYNYKWPDVMSLESKIPKHANPCDNLDRACITCRIFGMTAEKEEAGDETEAEVNALVGKVSFSDAVIEGKKNPQPIEYTAILGDPKPSCEQFYLIGPKNGRLDSSKWWKYREKDSQVRGRKFYWSHKPKEANLSANSNEKLVTKFRALPAGSKFRFSVSFEGLSSIELGLLLYTLELEDEMHHKLGLAKPLGCGTVKVNIEKMSIRNSTDVAKRYQKLRRVTSGLQELADRSATNIGVFLDAFKQALSKANDDKPFGEIANIADLKQIMRFPAPVSNVSYPGDYNWFQINKNNPLPTIQEEVDPKGRKLYR